MKLHKKSIIITTVAAILAVGIFLAYQTYENLFRQFQSLTVEIVNQSELDIVKVETGLLSGMPAQPGDSTHSFEQTIASGKKAKITPKLKVFGEGSIYMEFTDSSGKTTRKTVCSYTESASGYSTVTITDKQITVEERCF